MDITLVLTWLVAAIPQGVKIIDEIIAAVVVWEAQAQRRAFLAGCGALVRAIVDANLANPVPFTPASLVEDCVLALCAYGRRMNQEVTPDIFVSLGLPVLRPQVVVCDV